MDLREMNYELYLIIEEMSNSNAKIRQKAAEKIKKLGCIIYNDYKYIFKQCPSNINSQKRFIISGENDNILSKKGPNFVWTGTTCLYEFKNLIEYKWKIRIFFRD